MRAHLLTAVVFAALTATASAGEGPTIAFAQIQTLKGLPHRSVDWASARFYPVLYDALTEVGPDGKIIPALATEWTAESSTRWVFRLRKGVTFSNGEIFDPQTVVSTFAWLQSKEAATLAAARQFDNVASATQLDDHTVAITTKTPDVMLPGRLRTLRMLAPQHLAKAGIEGYERQPYGTGPFVAVSLQPGRLLFKANPSSWRPPSVSEITIVSVGESLARVQGTVSGAIDIALNTGSAASSLAPVDGSRLVAMEIGSVDAMSFVLVQNTPLSDARVRKALNHAVNKAALVDAFFHGTTKPATSFIAPRIFGYEDTQIEPFPYNPDKARKLLAEAGYPNGFETAIEVWIDNGESASIFQQIVADFSRIGVKAKLINVPLSQWQTDGLYGGRWKGPIFNFSYTAFPSFDPLDGLATHSCLWVTPFVCDKKIADQLVTARATFDLQARLRKTQLIFQDLLRDPPALLLYPSMRFDVLGPRVANYEAPFGLIRYDKLTLKW